MEFPDGIQYTKEHEWARVEGERVVVGITDFAQAELGDVVYVELPKVGSIVEIMGTFGVVESVKAVSDLYAPVSGTVVEVNTLLEERPELVNHSPYGEGWMIVLQPSDPSECQHLLSAEAYRAYVAQGQA
jgi:glycine cleavage system H protein